MTDEMKDTLSREEKRLILALVDLEPIREAETYSTVLYNVLCLRSLQEEDNGKIVGFAPVEEPTVEEDEPSVEEFSPPVMEAPKYTKEEVRKALGESRRKGINVTELLNDFGVDNFSALPAGVYGDVMARLGET